MVGQAIRDPEWCAAVRGGRARGSLGDSIRAGGRIWTNSRFLVVCCNAGMRGAHLQWKDRRQSEQWPATLAVGSRGSGGPCLHKTSTRGEEGLWLERWGAPGGILYQLDYLGLSLGCCPWRLCLSCMGYPEPAVGRRTTRTSYFRRGPRGEQACSFLPGGPGAPRAAFGDWGWQHRQTRLMIGMAEKVWAYIVIISPVALQCKASSASTRPLARETEHKME
ncbi:hypothetical protein NDU88_007310 [Pleurodeles waltl]|uniref:Uncharacterized protein n=1 Tax=Pleurodeles waltl TaxID=8319 RepID=A0AAV7PT63_PLEWA|nr:hypothetical protein NDU88_007310 [Pleurodeles waltl]